MDYEAQLAQRGDDNEIEEIIRSLEECLREKENTIVNLREENDYVVENYQNISKQLQQQVNANH